MIDTFENSHTRARFRLKRNWDGHDYAHASYANSKKEKSEMMIARVTTRAARCAMDAAAAATAEERAAFEAFCSVCGDTRRKLERQREREIQGEIRVILERCVELVARQYVVFEREAREYLFSHSLSQIARSCHLHNSHPSHSIISLTRNNTTRIFDHQQSNTNTQTQVQGGAGGRSKRGGG